MTAFVASYFVLAWLLASALTRAQGFWVFAACGLLIVVALVTSPPGRRTVVFALYSIVLAATASLLVFECLLRVAPSILSGPIANATYTGYHWYRGGIYFLDDHMGPAMRPNMDRETYWAGRWWRHRTNADGYRGPALSHADAVFLGDSMVYGHGVEESETVAARFAVRSRLATANLGQQGTCQIQSWIRFVEIGMQLKPALVFASVHTTDGGDATHWHPPEELELLLASPENAAYRPFARPRFRPAPWWNPSSLWTSQIELPLRCSGVFGAALRALSAGQAGLRRPSPPWTAPSPEEIDAPFAPIIRAGEPDAGIGWQSNVRSLQEIKRLCDRIGARLILFDLGVPRAFSVAVEAIAHDIGAEYSPAGRIALARAIAGQPIFLPDDGHWTPEGNDLVAAELVRAIGR